MDGKRKELLEELLRLIASENDPDALLGLRAMQGFCKTEGGRLEDALRYAVSHAEEWRLDYASTIEHETPERRAARPTPLPEIPECRPLPDHSIEIIRPGESEGRRYKLPSYSVLQVGTVARGLKDAMVAAVINKTRFRLCLADIPFKKRTRGEEVHLIADYEREGMAPVVIWAGTRGEAGGLAFVLRRALTETLPEIFLQGECEGGVTE